MRTDVFLDVNTIISDISRDSKPRFQKFFSTVDVHLEKYQLRFAFGDICLQEFSTRSSMLIHLVTESQLMTHCSEDVEL